LNGFLFAFLATLLAGIGARDQSTVVALSERQGRRPTVLLVALACLIVTTAVAAYAGSALAGLPSVTRNSILAMAFAIAGVEMLLARRRGRPSEPTNSLFALTLVLISHQITDAARLLVFAIAIATHAPLAAGVGGCVAGTTSIAAGWLAHGWFASRDLVIARRFCGAFVLLAGAWMGLALTGGY
jgi:putative Ca2+/H+ antiporter (TMEM165/GDT1 family)